MTRQRFNQEDVCVYVCVYARASFAQIWQGVRFPSLSRMYALPSLRSQCVPTSTLAGGGLAAGLAPPPGLKMDASFRFAISDPGFTLAPPPPACFDAATFAFAFAPPPPAGFALVPPPPPPADAGFFKGADEAPSAGFIRRSTLPGGGGDGGSSRILSYQASVSMKSALPDFSGCGASTGLVSEIPAREGAHRQENSAAEKNAAALPLA